MTVVLGILMFFVILGAAKALVGEASPRIEREPEDDGFEEWLLYEADDDEY